MTIRDRKVAAPGGAEGQAHRWIYQPLDLLKLEPATRARVLAVLDHKASSELFHDWEFWARPDQSPPPGDWIYG